MKKRVRFTYPDSVIDPDSGRTAEQLERRRGREQLKATTTSAARAAGVPMLAGTDVGNAYLVPGFSPHENLELMNRNPRSRTSATPRAELGARGCWK